MLEQCLQLGGDLIEGPGAVRGGSDGGVTGEDLLVVVEACET